VRNGVYNGGGLAMSHLHSCYISTGKSSSQFCSVLVNHQPDMHHALIASYSPIVNPNLVDFRFNLSKLSFIGSVGRQVGRWVGG